MLQWKPTWQSGHSVPWIQNTSPYQDTLFPEFRTPLLSGHSVPWIQDTSPTRTLCSLNLGHLSYQDTLFPEFRTPLISGHSVPWIQDTSPIRTLYSLKSGHLSYQDTLLPDSGHLSYQITPFPEFRTPLLSGHSVPWIQDTSPIGTLYYVTVFNIFFDFQYETTR